jgi:putative glycosyltransferase (TIGR04372 family)
MNLDKYKWFVTLHFRDRFFRNQIPGPRDTKNILTYIPLIEEIISRGGAVVRMGRGNLLDKLPIIKGLIDYPFSNFVSDRNDIVLCAKSRMFFGTNSGLCLVPFKFNVPVSLCNYIPFAKMSDFPGQYYYLKVFKNKKTNDYVSFREVLNSQAANSIDFLDYENCNYSIIDNSAEEIKDFFIESFDRLNNQYIESLEEKKLRERFNNLRKQSPFYYEGGGQISGVFLKKYSFLF